MKNVDKLIEEITKIKEECKENNWDGYGAEAINNEIIKNALIVVKIIGVIGCSLPQIGAEPGSITFEWYKSSTNILSISVDKKIYYVLKKNNEIKSGNMEFDLACIKELKKVIEEFENGI